MMRAFRVLVLSIAVCAAAALSVAAQDAKKSQRQEIPGGIEAKVKQVDAEVGKLTVTIDGRDRTFTITDDTTIVGPRGGVVRRRLKDPRFHAGLAITVVASGSSAKELHLGYDRKESDGKAASPKAAAKDAQVKARGAAPDDDQEDEFPGHVKSADPTKRILVVTLLNGSDRSFILAKDVKILIRGNASKQGLADPALKAGAPVTVVTEPGGRKVKEVVIRPAAATKGTK
jgi:hypothetical protein